MLPFLIHKVGLRHPCHNINQLFKLCSFSLHSFLEPPRDGAKLYHIEKKHMPPGQDLMPDARHKATEP